jgi:hypothetical protein
MSAVDDARTAGAREAERLGPVLDPDVLARVARILRPFATNGAPTARSAAANRTDHECRRDLPG